MRILGVDPGSRLTGYGCIEMQGRRYAHLTHGTLNLISQDKVPLEDRLLTLYEKLSEVFQIWKPQVVAIEKIFFAKNALSALKLGQARGVILLTARLHQVKVEEYSPTEVKKACAGFGQADKEQISKMVQLLLGKQHFETSDASDALALAICHAHLGAPTGVLNR